MGIIQKFIAFSICLFPVLTFTVNAASLTTNMLSQKAPFHFTVTTLAESEIDDDRVDDVKFKVNQLELAAPFAAFDVNRGKIILASQFRYTDYEFDSDNFNNNKLFEIALPITYIASSPTLTHIVRAAPGINSDLENITGDDVTFSGIYQAHFKSSDSLTWVLGAGIGHRFGESQGFPMLGAIYQPNSQLRFNLVLPNIEVSYASSDRLLWYVSLNPTGSSWNVEEKNRDKDVDIITEEIRFMAGAAFAVSNNIAVRAEVGTATGRNLDFTLANGDSVDLDIEDTTVASLSLEYRL